MPTVSLAPFTSDLAQDVFAGRRRADWAPTYPSEGDLHVSSRVVEGAWSTPTLDAPWGPWVVVEDGIVVGGVGFHGAPDADGAVEIGYGIAAGCQGRGIATAAVRQLLEFAIERNARSAFAMTDPDNFASQRVLQHCGFTLDGTSDDDLRWSLDLLPESPA